jgi:acetyltransferase-like isoleucine patch superfamily enzyme
MIRRIISRVRQQALARLCTLDQTARLAWTCQINNNQGKRDVIRIGARTNVAAQLLVFSTSGSIEIGNHCAINSGTRIWSACHVRIGDRVLISHDVFISDNNGHSLSASRRAQHFREIRSGKLVLHPDIPAAPITIEDDAWISYGAVILKGVTIGRGAVVSASAVVSKDVAPYAVVAGNPARKIGEAIP